MNREDEVTENVDTETVVDGTTQTETNDVVVEENKMEVTITTGTTQESRNKGSTTNNGSISDNC